MNRANSRKQLEDLISGNLKKKRKGSKKKMDMILLSLKLLRRTIFGQEFKRLNRKEISLRKKFDRTTLHIF